MISVAAVLQRVPGLDARTLSVWIERDWVRPVRRAAEPEFQEIDVARMRLILELHHELDVGEGAMPVVLSLLDQLHETRRQMRALCAALDAAPDEPARAVVARLGKQDG